jgi:pantoate--beta-alanine ligase
MVLATTKKELISCLSSSQKNERLGLVPTMGALHLGHLSLVSKAISENKKVVVSIFVNPTQFDNSEDLKKYPKTLEADMTLLASVSEEIIVLSPTIGDIYADDVKTKS